jgi:hypothetical protein
VSADTDPAAKPIVAPRLTAAEKRVEVVKAATGYTADLVAFFDRAIEEAFDPIKGDAPRGDVVPRIVGVGAVRSADVAFEVERQAREALASKCGRVRTKVEADRRRGHPWIALVVTLIDVARPKPSKVGVA